MLGFIQRKLLYPYYRVETSTSRPSLAQEGTWLDIPRVDVDVARLQTQNPESNPRPAIVFLHGNAESIDEWLPRLKPYTELGVDVLLPEYRGYGRSSGSPSKSGILHDILITAQAFSEFENIDGHSLLFHGRSLGGGIACELARHFEPRGLILESTFTRLSQLVEESFKLPPWLLAEDYDNEAFLEEYTGPSLIFHGEDDTLVPVSHARRLHRAGKETQLITLRGGTHNQLPRPWPEIKTFVRRVSSMSDLTAHAGECA